MVSEVLQQQHQQQKQTKLKGLFRGEKEKERQFTSLTGGEKREEEDEVELNIIIGRM